MSVHCFEYDLPFFFLFTQLWLKLISAYQNPSVLSQSISIYANLRGEVLTTVHIPGSWNIPGEHLCCIHVSWTSLSLKSTSRGFHTENFQQSHFLHTAVAAKHYHHHATLQSDTLKEKNLIKKCCLGMMGKFFTAAASCTLFCWFSSN